MSYFRVYRIVQCEADDSPAGRHRAGFEYLGHDFQFYNRKFFHGTFKLFIFSQSTSSNIGKGTFFSRRKPSQNMAFLQTNEHYSHVKEAYQNTVQSIGENDYTTRLTNVMDKSKLSFPNKTCLICFSIALTAFFNIRCALNEPRLLDLSNALFTATCTWLVHLALLPTPDQTLNEAEKLNVIEKLPLKFPPNRQLSYIPEFLVENVISYFKFLEIYNSRYMQVRFSFNETIIFLRVFS